MEKLHQLKKICHYITINQTSIFAFAGIFFKWTDIKTGEFIKSVSILTQSANPMIQTILLENIKKRQPVILYILKTLVDGWINLPITKVF